MADNRVPCELLDETMENVQIKKGFASLVSIAWNAPAQRYLLARVSVAGEETQELEDFKAFLRENAHLRVLIRHFEPQGARLQMPQVNVDLISILLSQLAKLEPLNLWQVKAPAIALRTARSISNSCS